MNQQPSQPRMPMFRVKPPITFVMAGCTAAITLLLHASDADGRHVRLGTPVQQQAADNVPQRLPTAFDDAGHVPPTPADLDDFVSLQLRQTALIEAYEALPVTQRDPRRLQAQLDAARQAWLNPTRTVTP